MRTTANGIFAIMCGMLLLLMITCSKDNDTVARELLATVPSNAGAVVLFDGEQMVEKAGGQENVLAALNNNVSEKARLILGDIQKVWTPTAVVMFMDGDNVYLTTRVDKPSDLVASIEKQSGTKLAQDGDLTYNGTFAVSGNQVWVSTGNSSLSATSIKKYLGYSETQSFAGVDYCDKIVESSKDIAGLLNVGSLVNVMSGGFTKAAGAQMALSTLFDNASYVSLEGEMKKGEMELEMNVLNAKFKTAKFLIPVGKIDVNVVKETAASAGTVFAINIDSKIVAKIKDAAKSLGGALPDEWLKMLEPLDGTIAVAAENPGSNISGVITTNGQSILALSQLLSEYDMQTSLNGKSLIVKHGPSVQGPLDVASVADRLKSSWCGMIMAGGSGMPGSEAVSMTTATLSSKDGGLQFKSVVTFKDKEKNALIQILAAK